MHLDVVPVLRCPREHEESGLVLAADKTDGRHVVTGVLGCPICEAEYPVRAGIAYFANREAMSGRHDEIDEIDVIRTAAMLGLTEPGGVIALGGQWASTADAISELVEALVLAVNPSGIDPHAERVSVIHVGDRWPIAPGGLRAAAIDTPANEVVGLLRAKGRLVAPVAVPIPPRIAELARDADYWVGERAANQPERVELLTRRTERR